MSKRAFWPGFNWRILAHELTRPRGAYTGEQIDIRSSEGRLPLLFDELVIDDWLHVEQMNDRDWWIGVGNQDGDEWAINVTIDRDGKASVLVEQNP